VPAFDAADIAEPLEYSFCMCPKGKCKGLPTCEIAGVVKEPTDKQIAAFQAAMRKEMLQAAREMVGVEAQKDVADMSPDEFLVVLERTDPAESEATLKRQAKIYSDLCTGKPSLTQLLQVPFRVRIAFFRWLAEEVTNPEGGAGAGKNGQVLTLAPPAAG